MEILSSGRLFATPLSESHLANNENCIRRKYDRGYTSRAC